MNFMTLKRIAIETKQSALKILEIEREYRKAIKELKVMDNIKELFKDEGKQN